MAKNNELIVVTNVQQMPKIEYNKAEVESFINYVVGKTENLLVTKENEKEMAELGANINKIVAKIKSERISKEKEIKEHIKEFVEDFKNWENQLNEQYRNIKNQIDVFTQETLEQQYSIMEQIKEELCKENNIENEIIKYIELPEQKGSLSCSAFTENTARKLMQKNIEDVLLRYNLIKEKIEVINEKENLNLEHKKYLLYINDINTCLKKIEDDSNILKEQRNYIIESEKNKIENKNDVINEVPIETKKQTKEIEEVIRELFRDELKLIITFDKTNKEDLEKAKKLKEFLKNNEIEYEVMKKLK